MNEAEIEQWIRENPASRIASRLRFLDALKSWAVMYFQQGGILHIPGPLGHQLCVDENGIYLSLRNVPAPGEYLKTPDGERHAVNGPNQRQF